MAEKIELTIDLLTEEGAKKGFLTYAEINTLLEDRFVPPERMDQIFLALEEGGIEVVDTSTPEQYRRFLLGTDIVVTSFERSSFYFRPSGIIHDALAAGCFVVAPTFPVFAAQVSAPARVGVTYETLDELHAAVGRAAAALEQGTDHARWRAGRNDAELLARLGEAIDRASDRDA